MNILTSQRGVGLIEVLVAVLLLSVAVLGFSALQMRAISATDESLVRTKSLTLVRNLAEVMRAYPDAYVTGSGTTFTSAKPTTEITTPSAEAGGTATTTYSVPTVQAIATSTVLNTATSSTTVSVDGTAISIDGAGNCLSTGVTTNTNGNKVPSKSCNINQLAARDVLLVKKIALDESIKVAVVTCPGTTAQTIQQQMCVITAWNDTKALMTDADTGDDANACANSDGTYKQGSQCLISEAY